MKKPWAKVAPGPPAWKSGSFGVEAGIQPLQLAAESNHVRIDRAGVAGAPGLFQPGAGRGERIGTDEAAGALDAVGEVGDRSEVPAFRCLLQQRRIGLVDPAE